MAVSVFHGVTGVVVVASPVLATANSRVGVVGVGVTSLEAACSVEVENMSRGDVDAPTLNTESSAASSTY